MKQTESMERRIELILKAFSELSECALSAGVFIEKGDHSRLEAILRRKERLLSRIRDMKLEAVNQLSAEDQRRIRLNDLLTTLTHHEEKNMEMLKSHMDSIKEQMVRAKKSVRSVLAYQSHTPASYPATPESPL